MRAARRWALALTASATLCVLVFLGGWMLAAPAIADCNSRSCEHRVKVRVAHTKWRAAVNAYGLSRLHARMRCESGGNGGYSLDTTGNGFWYAYQFEPRAWFGAGGRSRDGRPVGRWATHPSQLEQSYRAVVWERKHGGDPWPNCI